MCKSIADTHIYTAYEKYRQYLHQYSKSIAYTIGSNTYTAIVLVFQSHLVKLFIL